MDGDIHGVILEQYSARIARMSEKGAAPVRCWAPLEIKSFDEQARTFEAIASTPSTDRQGDIVEPNGARFKLPVSFIKGHKTDLPIGLVTEAQVTDAGIQVRGHVEQVDAPPSLKERFDVAWAEMKLKLIRGVSIGFIPTKMEPVNAKDPWGGIRFLEWEWLELSLVTIPANADATITSIKSFDLQGERAASGTSAAPASSNPGVAGSPKSKGIKMQTVAEQITGFEAKRAASEAARKAILDASVERATNMTPAEGEEFDRLTDEIDAADVQLKRMRVVQRSVAASAAPVDAAANGGGAASPDDVRPASRGHARDLILRPNANLPKGMAFVRYCIAIADSKNDPTAALERAKMWRDSTPEVEAALKLRATPRQIEALLLNQKAAVAPGVTTDVSWAGPLAPVNTMASEFIEFLYPMTILGRLTGTRKLPFNVKVSRMAAGASASKWVGEAKPMPLSKEVFDTVSLGITKIATIVVISEELARFSTPSAEGVIRADLAQAIAMYADHQFIDPAVAAVAGVSPASITNAAVKIQSTGTTIASVDTDTSAVVMELVNNKIPVDGCTWIMNPRTALNLGTLRTVNGPLAFPDINVNGGTFKGFPVITSQNVPFSAVSVGDTIAVLLKESEVLMADDGGIAVDLSMEASIEMTDTPTGNATSLVSLWQNGLVGIRAVRFINYAPRRAHAVAVWSNLAL